jgi:hypothetical protein
VTVKAQLDAALAGRYTLEREVGRGGMATVYLARDVRHQRAVALKVLSTELAAVVGTERFAWLAALVDSARDHGNPQHSMLIQGRCRNRQRRPSLLREPVRVWKWHDRNIERLVEFIGPSTHEYASSSCSPDHSVKDAQGSSASGERLYEKADPRVSRYPNGILRPINGLEAQRPRLRPPRRP